MVRGGGGGGVVVMSTTRLIWLIHDGRSVCHKHNLALGFHQDGQHDRCYGGAQRHCSLALERCLLD